MPSKPIDQVTQMKAVCLGIAVLFVAIGVYRIWRSELLPSSTTSRSNSESASTGYGAPAPQRHYQPQGDPKTWSEDDMKKFLSTRNMAVGHGTSKEELRAMVLSKLNEPTSTGFNDPREWAENEMREYLEANGIIPGNGTRMELLAMVESKMHEPK